MLGEKTEEYRSGRTHIRRRVYLYAGKKLAPVDGFPEEDALRLPRGVIVGSIAIVNCLEEKDCFAWELARPRRYRKSLGGFRRAAAGFLASDVFLNGRHAAASATGPELGRFLTHCPGG